MCSNRCARKRDRSAQLGTGATQHPLEARKPKPGNLERGIAADLAPLASSLASADNRPREPDDQGHRVDHDADTSMWICGSVERSFGSTAMVCVVTREPFQEDRMLIR